MRCKDCLHDGVCYMQEVCGNEIDKQLEEFGCPDFNARNHLQPLWIRVENRLPTVDDANPNEAVIAINKSDGFPRSWWYNIVSRYPQEFTHWMPFPEPPKGE